MLVNLREHRHPLPGAAFALSPWVDLEGLGDSIVSKADVDPMVERKGLVAIGKLYLGDADPRTPLAAPLYADLEGLPLMRFGSAVIILGAKKETRDRLVCADRIMWTAPATALLRSSWPPGA